MQAEGQAVNEHLVFITFVMNAEQAILSIDALKTGDQERLAKVDWSKVKLVEVSTRPADLVEQEMLEDLPGHDVNLALLKIEKGQTPTREELEDLRFAFLQAQRVADAAAGSEAAIVSMVHDPIKGFSTGMSHWATSLLATHLAKEFKDGGGINYLELDMRPCEIEGEAPIGPLTLLIQRKLGKSPGQINGELMAENAKLRAELATLSKKKKKRGKK